MTAWPCERHRGFTVATVAAPLAVATADRSRAPVAGAAGNAAPAVTGCCESWAHEPKM